MRELTPQEIKEFASRQKVQKTAVENFLLSMGSDVRTAINNLALDSYSYKWNKTTWQAIFDGIKLACTTAINQEVKNQQIDKEKGAKRILTEVIPLKARPPKVA